MRYLLMIVLILVVSAGSCAEIFPVGCQPIVVSNENVLLSAEKPSLVMIHNLSTLDVWITHPNTESNSNASWSSRLQAGHWLALLLGDKQFELVCIESQPGHEQQAPCANLLAICQWSKITAPKSKTATFLAGENLPLSALMAHIGSRGFILPASEQSVLD